MRPLLKMEEFLNCETEGLMRLVCGCGREKKREATVEKVNKDNWAKYSSFDHESICLSVSGT